MSELLFMEPVFKEAIWGGSRLKEVYGLRLSAIRLYYLEANICNCFLKNQKLYRNLNFWEF